MLLWVILNVRLVCGLLLISMWKDVGLSVIRLLGWVSVIILMFCLVGLSVVLFGVLLVMKVFMWLIDCDIFRFLVFFGILLVKVVVVLC